MTTNTQQRIMARAAMVGLLTVLVGCKCLRPVQISTDGRLVILQEPKSQTVLTNTPATFSVVAMHIGPPATNMIAYQWRHNAVTIPNATNSTYSILSAQFSNVGTYDVVVTGSTLTSQPAYLSVYSLSLNGGTLQTPIGYFSSQSVSCGGGTFTKGYAATNNDSSIAFIYGPNANPQTGPFLNPPPGGTSGSTFTVDTFSSTPGIDTGLRIRGNWTGLPVLACNDDASPPNQPGETDNHQSKTNITLSLNAGDPTTGLNRNSYRLTILYKDPPTPPQGSTVTINWKYQ